MLLRQLRHVSGIADTRMQQANTEPQLRFEADRARIAQLGLTEQNVTTALATALAGTGTDRAEFLAQPPEWRVLRHGHPDCRNTAWTR